MSTLLQYHFTYKLQNLILWYAIVTVVATHTTSQLTPTKYHNHAHAVQVIVVANVGAKKRRVREGTRTRLHKKPTCKWSCEYSGVRALGEAREDADDDVCRNGWAAPPVPQPNVISKKNMIVLAMAINTLCTCQPPKHKCSILKMWEIPQYTATINS